MDPAQAQRAGTETLYPAEFLRVATQPEGVVDAATVREPFATVVDLASRREIIDPRADIVRITKETHWLRQSIVADYQRQMLEKRRQGPFAWQVIKEMVHLGKPLLGLSALKGHTILDLEREMAAIGGSIFRPEDGQVQVFYLAPTPTDAQQIGEYVFTRFIPDPRDQTRILPPANSSANENPLMNENLKAQLHFRVHQDGSVYKDVLIDDKGERAAHRQRLTAQELSNFVSAIAKLQQQLIDHYKKALTLTAHQADHRWLQAA